MLYGKTETLSWFDESPYLRPLNVGSTPSAVLAINCRAYVNDHVHDQRSPERDALDFYCMNHLMAVVKTSFTKNEPLPNWAAAVAKTYLDVVQRQGNCMLYYMILITTRESRHVKSSSDELWAMIAKTYGQACVDFNKKIRGMGSGGAAETFMGEPPSVDIAPFISSLVDIFNKGGFSGGYGGKPWGQIAQCLQQFLLGNTSLEVMLDTSYTLAHNNGPMFNKGMLYLHYSNSLYTILDVQRSGQIPELIRTGEAGVNPSTDVMNCLTMVLAEKPNLFGDEVDWQKVKDLGALKNYSDKIAAQAAKKPKVTASGHLITGEFMVMPKKTVKIYQRGKAA